VAGEREGGSGFVTGLLLGVLAGASLAMIASPESGEKTRRKVADSVEGQTSELLERGRAIVERARARVDDAVTEGMEAAAEQRNELESRA